MPRLKLVVLGGGITGLSAAYEAKKQAAARGLELDLKVLEACDRPGGKIKTLRREGIVCEAGPDSFVTTKPQVLELVKELGLSGELLRTNPANTTVRVVRKGRLLPLPEGLMLVVPTKVMPFAVSPLLSWRAKARMALEPFVGRGPDEDESVGAFFRRRIGDEPVDRFVAPMLAGIHAADADRMSLASTFPQFLDMERDGGLLRGMWRRRPPAGPANPKLSMFMTLKGGLDRLSDALAAELPPEALKLGCFVNSAARDDAGWEIRAGGRVYRADAVISALPANVLKRLVSRLDPSLEDTLAEIPFAGTATVSLAYDAAELRTRLEGFGFLVPREENCRLAGATYVSAKFPGRTPEQVALIRCFLGGAGRERQVAGSDDELAETCAEELQALLALNVRPRWTSVSRWPASNPQYNIGHGALLKRLESRLLESPGLVLAGASYRGVGMPDCAASGRKAALEALGAGPSATGVF